MILGSNEIIREVANGNIHIDGFDPEKCNTNSYNLHLGTTLATYDFSKKGYLDPKEQNALNVFDIPEEGYVLQPGQLYLAATAEFTSCCPLYVPMLEGRSTWARLGLEVHKTAGFGDVGFEGSWTLEIEATIPILIRPNDEICQIYYQVVQGGVKKLYSEIGKYNNNEGGTIIGSRSYKDYTK